MADPLHRAAIAEGVRLLAPDRPGCGFSDQWHAHTVADWCHVALELADALELDRFAVLGASGGGVYALGFGALFPERVAAVGLVNSLTEPRYGAGIRGGGHRAAFGLAHISWRLPAAWLSLTNRRSLTDEQAEQFVRQTNAVLDGEPSTAPDSIGWTLHNDRLEAFAQGVCGVSTDIARLTRWGFRPQDVRVPVHLWHGERDERVSPAAARRLVDQIPDCRATYDPDGSHLTVLPRNANHILDTLAQPLR
jgi:pimeloyl-ACP methyl ester carboxylesterase